MLVHRSIVASFLALMVGCLAAGCGDTTPAFDPTTVYTPESLASELVFRYKGLHPDTRNVRKPQPPRKADAAATKEAKAATKEAKATTLDDLIRDITVKADSVSGMTSAEAIRKVAERVDQDASLPAADRKTITDRLRNQDG